MELTDEYYSIQEVADKLKVAYLTVYRWIKAGKLVAVKAGKQHRIKRNDLNIFLEERNVEKT
ncbi:MAG: DNA-binding protein [Candidatus Pacebacteria bacterium CG_4_10_14_0_8_um_filter_42_14]|nr:MAG: DNA-binding protein [Candidatus Pacebacteria bacterium CG_4_10_14_0_8_um_filter_42_14]